MSMTSMNPTVYTSPPNTCIAWLLFAFDEDAPAAPCDDDAPWDDDEPASPFPSGGPPFPPGPGGRSSNGIGKKAKVSPKETETN